MNGIEGNQTEARECIGCLRRERELADLTVRVNALRDSVAATTAERDLLRDEVNELQSAEPAPVQLPSLTSVIQHCQDGSCEEHAAEWDEIKGQIADYTIEHLPEELIRRKAGELGLVPPVKEIIIHNIEGLISHGRRK